MVPAGVHFLAADNYPHIGTINNLDQVRDSGVPLPSFRDVGKFNSDDIN